MGKKNKKSSALKPNVFKVAGAKSLKKTKAKAVNLGLKNIQQKVKDLDNQFLEDKKNPTSSNKSKPKVVLPDKKLKKKITKDEVAKTTGKIEKMDI